MRTPKWMRIEYRVSYSFSKNKIERKNFTTVMLMLVFISHFHCCFFDLALENRIRVYTIFTTQKWLFDVCVCVPLQSWRMPIMPNVMARGWVREWCGLWKSFLRSTANIVRNSIVVVVAVDFIVPISIINTITRNFFLRIGNRFMYVFSFFLRCFVIIAVAAAAVDVEHHARVERWSIWVVKSIGCELSESCEEEEAYPICAFVE